MFYKKYSNKNELAKHFTFVVDDDVYVGVNDNAYPLTNIPQQSFKGINHHSDKTCRWGGNDYIYLGYIPVAPRYEGRLLNCLTCMTIVRSGDFYLLAPSTAGAWLLLEKNLLQIYDHLIATARMQISFPLEYTKPEAPSTRGYLKEHHSHSAALGAAHGSRHAFDILMAALSFAIMLHNPEKDSPDDNPSWAQLLEKKGVHAEYIQLLKESQIADFSVQNKRVGTIVSWKSKWLSFLERMEVANVPFWIHFGNFRTNQNPYVNCNGGRHARRYTPTLQEVTSLRQSSSPITTVIAQSGGPSKKPCHSNQVASSQGEGTSDSDASTSNSGGWGASNASWGASTSNSGGWGESTQGWGTSTSSWGEGTQDWGSSSPSWGASTLDSSAWAGATPDWGMPTVVSSGAISRNKLTVSAPPQFFDGRPPPDRKSRQKPGETWREFFAREQDCHNRRWANASEVQLKSWASREATAAKHGIPGKKGPLVYVWEENLDFPRFLYRTYVERGSVEDVWGDYSKTQRRFNKFENEWDLCREFDLNAVSDRDIKDNYFYPDSEAVDPIGPPPPSPPLSATTTLAPPSPPPTNFVLNLQDTYNESDDLLATIPSSPIEIMLRNYYGFLWYNEPYCPVTPLEWEEVTTFLLHHNEVLSSPDLRNAICYFVHCRINGKAAPPSLWDLNMYAEKPLYANYDHRISVQIIQKKRQPTYYVLRTIPALSSCLWLLVLQHAATVLECLRYPWGQGDVSTFDIAKHLFAQGMPFIILCPPPRPCPSSGLRYGGHQCEALGWRRHNHQFTDLDYNSYLARRLEFFKQLRARAALEMQGIVGRLARESIGQDVVLMGPALEDGHIRKLSVNGGELWGDMLSDKDLDLICGVYKVEQDSGRRDHTSDTSYWPKYSTWIRSGLNIGYWPPFCETWFEKRKAKILAGSGPKMAGQWANSLRYHFKETSRLYQSTESESSRYLAFTIPDTIQ